jgi:transcriptional regulator GlxA family with amidase domain
MARPGDQSQFSVRLEALPTNHSVVRAVMDVITASPSRNHTLSALAATAGVSARHLSRLFLAETGHTPQHFVDRTRLEAACAMLTGGQASLDQIAERTGLGSSESLRRLFHRELAITPSAYRNRFKTAKP